MEKYKLTLMNKDDFQFLSGNYAIMIDSEARATDLHILSGGGATSRFVAWYWITRCNNNSNNCVNSDEHISVERETRRCGGIRPVIEVEDLNDISYIPQDNGKVLFGEYPQFYVPDLSPELERTYQNGMLSTTERHYSLDGTFWQYESPDFKLRTFREYTYKDRHFIRFVGDENGCHENLWNLDKIEMNKAYWIEVKPVTWYLDENRQRLISKYVLLSGIRYVDLESYLKLYMTPEIAPRRSNSFILDSNQDLRSLVYRKIKK